MINSQKAVSILNTLAGASDCVSSGGVISITGLNPFPSNMLRSLKIRKNMQVQPLVWTVTATAVVGEVVNLKFQQPDGTDFGLNGTYSYEFASTTASALTTDLTTWLSNNGFDVSVASNSGSPTVILTITPSTTYPMMVVSDYSSTAAVTVAVAMPTVAPHATAGTAIAGTTTVTCTTLASQDFRTGDIMTIVAGSGYTFTQNGVSGLTYVTCRITYATATTFTLNDVVGAGTNGSAPTFTKVATEGLGSVDYVNAQASLNGSEATATGTTYMYDMVEITGGFDASNPSSPSVDSFDALVFVKANLIASPYTVATNYAACIAALEALEAGV